MDIDDVDRDVALATGADLPNLRDHGEHFDAEAGPDHSGPGLPTHVQAFIKHFYANLHDANEVHACYESVFNRMTERFYKNQPWPKADAIAHLCNNDATFLCLYEELCYRHVYSRLSPVVETRLDSWANYNKLFGIFTKGGKLPALPAQWLWDMVDEAVFQFQSFAQYVHVQKHKSEADIAKLQGSDAWNVFKLLQLLDGCSRQSGVFEAIKKEPVELGDDSTRKMMGYFCVIGILRVHCLIGDYHTALRCLDNLDFHSKAPLLNKVAACHVTAYYYMGFAYMMLQRHTDAITTFSQISLYITRTQQYHTRSYQYDQILKKNERMYALLAMLLTLSPTRVDDSVSAALRERYSDKMYRMHRCDDAAIAIYEELFQFACPKFVSIHTPNFAEAPAADARTEAYRHQLGLFSGHVRSLGKLSLLRSFLVLYSTINTAKVAGFLKVEAHEAQEQLMCLRKSTHSIVNTKGAPLSGEVVNTSDVPFAVDSGVVHMADQKPAKLHSEYFVRHIKKFGDMCNKIQA